MQLHVVTVVAFDIVQKFARQSCFQTDSDYQSLLASMSRPVINLTIDLIQADSPSDLDDSCIVI